MAERIGALNVRKDESTLNEVRTDKEEKRADEEVVSSSSGVEQTNLRTDGQAIRANAKDTQAGAGETRTDAATIRTDTVGGTSERSDGKEKLSQADVEGGKARPYREETKVETVSGCPSLTEAEPGFGSACANCPGE